MRISVNCSRKGWVALPSSSSSSSAVHRPSFGRGCTSRSYSAEVAPDRRTLRTVFRDTLRSRAISLIVLPLRKCSRRIRPIVSTVSIPPPPASNQSEQRIRPNGRGSILDADNPAQGVKIARRNTLGIRRKGSDPLAQYVGMHSKVPRCLRDRDPTLLHQPHSLKLELSCIAFAFHRSPPAPE